ncbi:prolyl 4-hydroxylase subunit alpha-1-like [Pectinophora gossypiella]|uniref:prolyl 4-hydroxylase subunit alpha-1-like n=1 Tax=Pectinophora gossypiella TaxID=13191 RepID=UPI00214EC38A|nr:prolyl 4-hydroxylase subunit alpha-1-like [Pectinophora gossypiella]
MCRSKLEYAEASAETGDIYASTAQIRMLLLTQTRVIQRIQDYVNKEKIRLETIKGFLKNTRKEHRKALMDVSQYLDNPINAFRLIRRLTSDLEKLEAYMPARVTVYRKNQTLDVYYPDPGEMAEAAYGLVRLQMIYKLQASDLANGILKGTFSKSGRQFIERVRPLTSSDCFFLGHVSYKDLGVFIAESPRFDTKRKLRWMLEAHKKFIQENCTFCPVEELEIIDHISTRYEDLGDLKNSILWIQKRIAAKPDDPKRKLFAEIMKGMQKTLITARFPENKPEVNETLGNGRGDSNSKPPKSSICYTKPGIPSKLDHRLSCYFAHGPHPFLRLARLKAEQMHINPNITLYYEVLSESRMRSLKEASGVLTRARVADKTKPNYRIAKDMNYNNNVENEWISKQIIQITNMNMPLDAPVEVLNYGIGGHYASHYDFFGVCTFIS